MAWSEAEAARITRAVEDAERHTGAEIVVVGFSQADGYLDVAFRNAFLIALSVLGLVLALPVEVHEEFVFPLVAGASILGLVVSRLRPIARLTSSRRRRADAIRAAMSASFLDRGVSRTRERVGLLVAAFELEGEAAVLFDVGLHARVPDDVRAALVAIVQEGFATVDVERRALCLETLGARLGAWVPRAEDDVDELANVPTLGGGR